MALLKAFPRVHITLIDLGDATDRAYGGVGFAINSHPVIVSCEASEDLDLVGFEVLDERGLNDVNNLLQRIERVSPGFGAKLTLLDLPPQHTGFGSKTALLMAVAAIVNKHLSLGLGPNQLQLIGGRGGASGVGVHAFFEGGLIADAGHERSQNPASFPSSAQRPKKIPLRISRQAFPEAWEIALIVPQYGKRYSGNAEVDFFRTVYPLNHFRSRTEPYDEDYSLETEELLGSAIDDIRSAYGLRSVFFVEDTSLRIECLSDQVDFPGVGVKEWFQDVNFDEIQGQIETLGGDRRATVKSDIALHIPTLSHPIFFHGETKGVVAETPPDFEPSIQYPWLTPDTFNGWFIPDGSDTRLGNMSFEESLRFDFRAKSLRQLLERLVEMSAVLSLQRPHYTATKPPKASSTQLSLNLSELKVLVVIGEKCAGKTTFGDFAIGDGHIPVFEASAVLRSFAESEGASIQTGDDAKSFLETYGQDIVARRIANLIGPDVEQLVIVQGLRTIEEIEFLSQQYPGLAIVQIVADERIRFERHIKRARDLDAKTFSVRPEMS